MMPGEGPSEEKLLKLIRKKSHTSAGEKKEKPPEAQQPKRSIRQIIPNAPQEKEIVVTLNRAWMFVAFALSTYLIVYKTLFFRFNVPAFSDVKNREAEKIQNQLFVQQLKPFDYYAQRFAQKDLFKTALPREELPIPTQNELDPELTNQVRVVGIILDESPQAVIEDLKTNQTVFLKKGDSFRGALVEEIRESKIILSQGGKRVELGQ